LRWGYLGGASEDRGWFGARDEVGVLVDDDACADVLPGEVDVSDALHAEEVDLDEAALRISHSDVCIPRRGRGVPCFRHNAPEPFFLWLKD
jgi:hypothetical protein